MFSELRDALWLGFRLQCEFQSLREQRGHVICGDTV